MNFHGFLNNLSEEFEESTITVGNTLGWGNEAIELLNDGGLNVSLGLEERLSGNEPGLDNGSAIFDHSKD